jgi:two-component system sensor histidine kinase/response regulator
MKQHKILVIDDQPDNLKIIVDYLKESGTNYTILKAPNGKIACKIAEKKMPDLIITDWEMPEMDGIETIKYLKSKAETKDIPIIMASGVMTQSKNLKMALEAGAVDYIRKPVDKTELIARVHSMLKLADSYKEIKLLNATKDKFFSIISHDLRSPFHAIMGISGILVKKFDRDDLKEHKRLLDVLNDEIKNTYQLVENLLLWSTTQRELIKLIPKKENLYLFINKTLTLLRPFAMNKSILLTNKAPEDFEVFADAQMLAIVLRNLISNAIKFTPNGGEVSISACIKTSEDNKSSFEVRVKDSGIGIRPEIQSKIFTIDGNISTKGTENEVGTGLGLILCKEFIEKHNGKIGVESEIGKGLLFGLHFP